MRQSSVLLVAALAAACGIGTVSGDGVDPVIAGEGAHSTDGEEQEGLWAETRDDDVVDGELEGGQRAAASAPSADQRASVRPGTTDDAERVQLLHLGRSEGSAPRRVVLQLRPDQLPQLARGDLLMTPAEVQVTTRCDVGQVAPGCGYSPKVAAQIIITGDGGDTHARGDGSKAIAGQSLSCSKAEHHCMFVFRPSEAQAVLTQGFALPCVVANRCFVNLVMWAWHPEARAGGQDTILVGGNDGNFLANGRVEGDQARLMAVRERGLTAADRAYRRTAGGGDLLVNTRADPVLIYSHRLKPAGRQLKQGEQFVVEGKVVTAVSGRARFSTKLFLTKDPRATDGGSLNKIAPGSIGEHNGINCTAGTSPCTTRKVAVFRVTEDIEGAVFVNLVAKSAVPGGGSARVVVQRGRGWLRSVRYPARLAD